MKNSNLNVNVAGVEFQNPVIAASGTFGFGLEYVDYLDINTIGGISVKGLTLKPRKGNPPPRIAETPSGILNSVGLQNPGIDYFLEEDLPNLRKYSTKIIANINGNTVEEYCQIAAKLRGQKVDMVEVNLSCPNVKEGGMVFGTDPKAVASIARKVKKEVDVPLIIKLTPNVTDICEIALAAQEGGADALSLVNTLLGMAIDPIRRKPILGNVTGGLSGPAIKPIALRMVWQVCNVVNIPVIGMGGIMTGEDVVEFLLAGASAISVGAANVATPEAMPNIIGELKSFMLENGISHVKELIGALEI